MRTKKVKKCAEWLAYCLEIGWDKSQLDALEKLWMDNHDDNGNFKPNSGNTVLCSEGDKEIKYPPNEPLLREGEVTEGISSAPKLNTYQL